MNEENKNMDIEEKRMESAGGSANCKVVKVVLVILVPYICQCGTGNIGPIYLSMWYW